MVSHQLFQILFDNTYQETLGLLTRSEQFLRSYSIQRANTQNHICDLRVNCEMTRVTARLTQVMAWLLAQKAALAGEITLSEACSDKYMVQSDPFCTTNSLDGQEGTLPIPVEELLTESRGLYQRILVLAEQMKKRTIASGQTSQILN
jgi:regulator of CtrA degradation